MGTIGTLPGERLAGLSADLFHKLQAGNLSVEELALFVQRKNPFAFERNEHGHIIVTISSLDLTGAQEMERLESGGYRVSDYAKSCFLSTKPDSYDANHRLVAGQDYRLALVPGKAIPKGSDRTTENIRKLGTEFGYGKSLAGFVPRIREKVSDKQMEEMGFQYLVSPHHPITGSGGGPGVLNSRRVGGGPWVDACGGGPGSEWGDEGAFMFPVPASKI